MGNGVAYRIAKEAAFVSNKRGQDIYKPWIKDRLYILIDHCILFCPCTKCAVSLAVTQKWWIMSGYNVMLCGEFGQLVCVQYYLFVGKAQPLVYHKMLLYLALLAPGQVFPLGLRGK